MLTTLFRPWRERRTWTSLVQVATTIPVSAITIATTISLLAVSVALLIVLPVAVPFIWLFFAASHLLADLERSRLDALAGLDLRDPVPPLQSDGRRVAGFLRRLWERTRSGPRWKEAGYLVLIFPVGMLLGIVTLLAWIGSLALIFLPAYVGSLPGGTAKLPFVEIGPGSGAWIAAALGIIGLLAAPWITPLHAALERRLATVLLGPGRDAELASEVDRLEVSRSAAVDTAEAERRRIERDLHDGAQQRLVALAVQLGAAQERLETDPAAGKAMVAAAHDEAKAALAEIRDLVRGIHPVILDDRGLDAALSAVVARAPLPVDLHVDVTVRPPAPVESAAYFIVSEALTNVARHADATRATVEIVRSGDTLVIEVGDDGVGGADPALGSGLAGLQQRVAGLGGRMHVLSPAGGPTSVIVELSCRS